MTNGPRLGGQDRRRERRKWGSVVLNAAGTWQELVGRVWP